MLGQMMKLPMAAFVYGMELLGKVIGEVQKAANQSIDDAVSGITRSLGDAPDLSGLTQATEHNSGSQSDSTIRTTESARDGTDHGAETLHKEEREMPDTNLSDEMLKLVRYKILFVKRDYETAFREVEELVHDDMTASAYSGWKIAEFIQNLGNAKTEIPEKWKDYPSKEFRRDGKLIGFPESDKKYLRVYFEVLDRYVREEFKYEEDQIDVLKEIRDAILKENALLTEHDHPGSSAASGSAAVGTADSRLAGGGRGTAK